MRLIRDISAEEENFRFEQRGGINVIRRDGVKPEPEGTLILMPFKIIGYDRDCDGSLMARLEHVSGHDDMNNEVAPPTTGFVVTPDELSELFAAPPGEEAP